jgi:MipA family protein
MKTKFFNCNASAIISLTLSLIATTQAHAEGNPPSEYGLGLATISYPSYRGSDQNNMIVLPAPYLEYNGKFLKADREGIRGQLFDSPRLELSMSVSGSPPTKSDGITRRKGMPDLKPSFEFGPVLSVLLTPVDDKSLTLKLRLPVRQAITLERRPQNAGLVFSPNLNLDIANPFGLSRSNFGVIVGPIFSTKRQHDYFYTVDQAYATAERPAYESRGGYAGSQFLLALSHRAGDIWAGAYVRYDSLKGAVFADSPLVATRHYTTAGIAVSYVFGRF